MKALQKNQGRTDQMLGAMADVLTSVAMPNQQWVSWCLLRKKKKLMSLVLENKQTETSIHNLAVFSGV